jgi:hypothetical protein
MRLLVAPARTARHLSISCPCSQGTQTDQMRTPCHHEHLLAHPQTTKKSHGASTESPSCVSVAPLPSPQASHARGGRQYILQHSPQRAGVTSVGIRNLPSAHKAPATARQRLPSAASPSAPRPPRTVYLQPKEAGPGQHNTTTLHSGEAAEAAAWLSVARDDVQMLMSALSRVPVNLADEDGETLLLCACRCALLLRLSPRIVHTTM